MGMNKFSASSPFFVNFEFVDRLENRAKGFAMNVSDRQSEVIDAARVNQPRGKDQQFCTQSLQSGLLPALRQTQKLEPLHEIVSQNDQIKMRFVGQKVVSGNFAQRKTFFEFFDIQFGSGSTFVKMPNARWGKPEVGDENVIKIMFGFPESGLLFLLLSAIVGTTHRNKTVRFGKIVWLIKETGGLPAVAAKGAITQSLNTFAQGLGQFGNDHKSDSSLVEGSAERVIVESGIGPQANPIKIRRQLLQAFLKEDPNASRRSRVAGSQNSVPATTGVPLETQQRVIAGATPGFCGL